MNLKNRIVALVAAAAIAVPAIAAAKFFVADKSKSSVKVVAKIPASTIEGIVPDVTIADDGTTLTVNVALGSVDTKMEMRNRHFRERMRKLHTSLVVQTADVKSKIAAGQGVINGKLTLNGVAKDVKVDFKLLKDGTATMHHVDASIVGGINRKDFEIGKPRSKEEEEKHGKDSFCYLGICVADKIDIKADLWVSKG